MMVNRGIVHPHLSEESSTVLIVDDNEDKRELLAVFLKRGDFIVIQAESGQDAFTIMKKIRPDVILLDALMPGMDGYEVCSKLKSDPNLAEIPVLFVTVLNQNERRIEGLDIGADDFISWPVDPKELIARIHARIRSQRPLVDLRRTVEQQVRLLNEERQEKEETNFELERARLIQQRFLCTDFPKDCGLVFAECYRPSRKVGGDFYDVISGKAGEVFFMMADVSGHGVPAAMLTGLIKVLFRTGIKDHGDPKTLLKWFNNEIGRYLSTGEFLTMFVGLWKATGHQFQYAGAGHPPALLVTSGGTKVDRLDVSEGVVGVITEKEFVQKEIVIEIGQRLVCYTDGITETMSCDQTLFGEDRLADLCARGMRQPLSETVRIVFQEIAEFSAGAFQQDDQALLIMEVVA